MDELLALGCIVIFFILPILTITALKRSAAVRDELVLLRRRVEELEASGGVKASGAMPDPEPDRHTELASPTMQPDVTPLSSVSPPESATELAISPLPSQDEIEEIEVPSAKAEASSAFGGIMSSLVRWFFQGNPLAKLGVLLLFFGLAFLLRYTVEHALLPLELRLAIAALFAIVLLLAGWRLRHKQPVYALILQGGATGALYLTVFGAFRLWQMLPMTLAFVLLILICVASVGLALLQKALSLAMLASLGGYLAPLLLSSGSGNHVALFSFYILLSIGILAISARQHWRELNLLGLIFTFGVGGLWGVEAYQPAYYLSCQLFLIANLFLFGVVSVVLSLRAQDKQRRVIDGVLLFAPPLIGFGMQYAITRHMAYGPAFSALGYGCFYLALGWLALRRYPSQGRPLILAALALGGTFATLAIPLALSASWTAIAWSLEGLGILWLGVQQQQKRMSYSGTALLIPAVVSALWSQFSGTTPLSLMLIFAILSLCWLAAAWLWRTLLTLVSRALLTGGLCLWVMALIAASRSVWHQDTQIVAGVLALITLSVWGWRYVADRLAWQALDFSKWLLWPAMLVALIWQITHQQILLAGWPTLAWCLALPGALLLLYRDGERLMQRLSQGLHLSLCWMVLLALALELMWFVQRLSWGMEAWACGLPMAAGGMAIILIHGAIRRQIWPFRVWPVLYRSLAMVPVAAILLIMLLINNLQDGLVFRQLYLPLINPLEEGAAFALLGVVLFSHTAILTLLRPTWQAICRPWLPVALAVLCFWWLNGALLRALAIYGDVSWTAGSLWHSRLIQTSLALFWMLAALVVMLHATRRRSRHEWLCGAALLGVVIAKLMLVDSAQGGGLARAIAFIGVAILVLIVGYISPLPPKTGEIK